MSTALELPLLSSLGHELQASPESFGFIEPSNDLLDDPEALRARLDNEGYLYIKNFFDLELIEAGRRSILEKLGAEGLLDPESDLMEGVISPEKLEAFALDAAPKFVDGRTMKKLKAGAFRPDLAVANKAIERVTYGPELMSFYTMLFGEPVLHFDYTWLRVMGPGFGTPTHCDWVYMGRGSRELLTCWIPYGNVPLEVGGLILLERSHLQAERIKHYLEKDVDAYCENKPTEVEKVAKQGGWSFQGWLSNHPQSLPEKFKTRWLTCREWQMGDFITFNMTLIHGSLDNHSDRVRVSSDTRYQPASQPADGRWIGANPPGHGLAGKLGRVC
ncbi:MAG: phytanoyl-CoA dioxygenase family protein [Verrucomicrobiota bacterium]|nr:phytanoyl-CoA dioxygenase family protein [Verrucomicrobiota bacterium]